jgi:hypothetical protein
MLYLLKFASFHTAEAFTNQLVGIHSDWSRLTNYNLKLHCVIMTTKDFELLSPGYQAMPEEKMLVHPPMQTWQILLFEKGWSAADSIE